MHVTLFLTAVFVALACAQDDSTLGTSLVESGAKGHTEAELTAVEAEDENSLVSSDNPYDCDKPLEVLANVGLRDEEYCHSRG